MIITIISIIIVITNMAIVIISGSISTLANAQSLNASEAARLETSGRASAGQTTPTMVRPIPLLTLWI